MRNMSKKVFEGTVKNIPIWLLDAVIIAGIAAMAVLIPWLSHIGREKSGSEASEKGSAVSEEYIAQF